MAFDIRALRYFVQVAELGNMSLAARALNIAQPALSQQISGMEDHLGVQLLLRSARGVELTEEGARLLLAAREILQRFRRVEEELNQHSGILRGTINIGMPAPVANVVIEPLFRRIRASYPELILRIEEARSPILLDGLLSGHFDLTITANAGESGRIESVCLVEEFLHLVGPRKAALGGAIKFDQILDLPLVLSSHIDNQQTSLSIAASRLAIKLNIVLISASLATTKRLIAAGDVYAIMTWSAAAEAVREGMLTAAMIVEPQFPRALYLSQVHDRRHSRVTRLVADAIKALTTELQEQAVFR